MFSENESAIIKALGDRTLTIKELTKKHYKGSRKKPLNPTNVVACTINRINLKCRYHRLNWFINGAGIGRGGRTVWRDKKEFI